MCRPSRTASPWGSFTAGLSDTYTCASQRFAPSAWVVTLVSSILSTLAQREQRSTGDPLVRFAILCRGGLNHLRRQRRRWRLPIPPRLRQPIAHALLVERRLVPAGLVELRIPETGAVRRQQLVGDRQLAVDQAELQLRIGNDDPTRAGVLLSGAVDGQRRLPQPLSEIPADEIHHSLEGDVFVVPGVRLGSRGEDRLVELRALGQPLR